MLIVVVVLLVGLALVSGATGLLGLLGRLPGNSVLGVRTPETRKSPRAWVLANKAAGPTFIAAAAALALGALGLGLIGGWVGGLVVVVALVGALVLLNVSGLAGARAAAVWQASQEDDDEGGCGCGSEGGCSGPSAEHNGGDSPEGGCASHSPSGCGTAGAGSTHDSSADPSVDCGVTGGCGSCALQGTCETEPASN